MQQESTTKVYNYIAYDARPEGFSVARHKATREAILQRLSGQVLEGTEQEVPLDELDGDGRYRRLATGWGELA